MYTLLFNVTFFFLFQLSSGDAAPTGFSIPFPTELIDASKMKGKFSFAPPSDVKVLGSFLLKTMIKANCDVDIAVEIPEVKFYRI